MCQERNFLILCCIRLRGAEQLTTPTSWGKVTYAKQQLSKEKSEFGNGKPL